MYKVGDKVVIVTNTSGGHRKGTECVIISTPDNPKVQHPKYNNRPLWRLQKVIDGAPVSHSTMWHPISDFEVVEKQPSLFEMEDIC